MRYATRIRVNTPASYLNLRLNYPKYGAPQQPPIYSAQSSHTAEAAEASKQRSTGPAMRTLQLEDMFRPIEAGGGTRCERPQTPRCRQFRRIDAC